MKSSSGFGIDDRVSTEAYGPGTIRETDDRYTTVAFDKGGTRKFVTSMMRLDRSDVPAPTKPVRGSKKAAKR